MKVRKKVKGQRGSTQGFPRTTFFTHLLTSIILNFMTTITLVPTTPNLTNSGPLTLIGPVVSLCLEQSFFYYIYICVCV